ncbi:LuxR C-terminal-related transcriptional regulator [Micromonospora chersina]|uniref:LuxR C-terminal-related transcriptional regulator n=1 Tax=Micromonospora chersina TaxID=47854 RepID=UPI003792B932
MKSSAACWPSRRATRCTALPSPAGSWPSHRSAEDFSAQVFPDLALREREVLDLMSAGCRNHEIARRLVLSEKTSATTSRPC